MNKNSRDPQKRFRYVKLMSTGSVNLYKSFTYEQPEEYRFSHDSVFLARRIFEIIRDQNRNLESALDLCAGCGIVGLDFAFHLLQESKIKLAQIDFLEVQKVYEPFLKTNFKTLSETTPNIISSDFYFENYGNLSRLQHLKSHYDLILCNPPYFRVHQGKLSPSDFKNRCRFFIDSGFKELIEAIEFLLKPQGSAYILIQSLHDHKIDSLEELKAHPNLELYELGKIRSTDLFELKKIR